MMRKNIKQDLFFLPRQESKPYTILPLLLSPPLSQIQIEIPSSPPPSFVAHSALKRSQRNRNPYVLRASRQIQIFPPSLISPLTTNRESEPPPHADVIHKHTTLACFSRRPAAQPRPGRENHRSGRTDALGSGKTEKRPRVVLGEFRTSGPSSSFSPAARANGGVFGRGRRG